jgi:hypothetical protein
VKNEIKFLFKKKERLNQELYKYMVCFDWYFMCINRKPPDKLLLNLVDFK